MGARYQSGDSEYRMVAPPDGCVAIRGRVYDRVDMEAWDGGVYSSPPSWRVVRRQKMFEMELSYRDAYREVMYVPKDRFIRYEGSDMEWMTYFGIAEMVPEPLVEGTYFNLKDFLGMDLSAVVAKVKFPIPYGGSNIINISGFVLPSTEDSQCSG